MSSIVLCYSDMCATCPVLCYVILICVLHVQYCVMLQCTLICVLHVQYCVMMLLFALFCCRFKEVDHFKQVLAHPAFQSNPLENYLRTYKKCSKNECCINELSLCMNNRC